MFDTRFFAFAAVAALLVVSPGATMVVVADAAIDAGRRAGLWTVTGVGTANGSLAIASAFGLSALFLRFPQALHVVATAGAAYLAWLGARAMVRAVRPGPSEGRRSRSGQGDQYPGGRESHGSDSASGGFTAGIAARFGRGLLTNYTNPSVVLFYTVVVPQFIGPREAFLQRYLLLGGTHVAMSVVWLCAFAISVGTLAEHMTRPAVRRTTDGLTGVALLAFAVKLLLA